MKIIFTQFIVSNYYSFNGVIIYYRVGFFYPTYFLSHTLEIYSITFIFGFIKVFRAWFFEKQNRLKLEIEKTDAELNFLKSQINPHFLFNILNNLYALSLKKSPDTPEMILRLSSIMDFIIHETASNSIPLAKEIHLLEDYIELEKLRYGNDLNVIFIVENIDENILIAPLILFPFVENSFKHGVSNSLNEPIISIKLKMQDNFLFFSIINSKTEPQTDRKPDTFNGIGLKNVKKRLDLIYMNNYTLDIQTTDSNFKVTLTINLNPI